MQHLEIPKLCADSLRTFTNSKYGIKLKAAHAHELVAAYFGYASKNAMLADSKYSIANLNRADVVVMTPDDDIEKRKKDLEGLSPQLPDTYTLGEPIYASLFTDELWTSNQPPFRSFKTLAKYLCENSDNYKSVFKFYTNVPMEHFVEVNDEKDVVTLTVVHTYRGSAGEQLGAGQTTIRLNRVAGRIGFSNPQMSVEKWTGGARESLGFRR